MMATFLGLHFFFGVKPHIWMDTGILLMFYALYYGVVARDVAEYCTEKMVVQIGVSTQCLKITEKVSFNIAKEQCAKHNRIIPYKMQLHCDWRAQ